MMRSRCTFDFAYGPRGGRRVAVMRRDYSNTERMLGIGATVAPVTQPTAAGAPTRVGRAWVGRFSLAWVGVMIGFYGPIQILLPNQAEALAPDHKEYVLALVTAVGAICSLFANPLWGALSDRTTSRRGRRRPWIVAGTLTGALSLAVLAAAPSVVMMLIGWCLVQTTLNATWAGLSAAVPDQVPSEQRGAAAGYLGLAQMIGVVVAIGLASVLPGAAGYLACAVVMILVIAPFVVKTPDATLHPDERPPWSWRAFARSFWISPKRYPDFGWAWLTRFLINLGNGLALVFLLYLLRDELGWEDAELGVLILGGINLVGTACAVLVAGVWSDRVGRRRVFVSAAGVLMAVATVSVAVSMTWPVLLVVAFVLGVGMGVYTSVDFALITEVLPDGLGHGKDMGVLNIAAAMPQVVAPLIAAVLVTHLGGYRSLFTVAGAACLIGALLVHRIRTVA